jgi:hypothetical protein
MLQNKPVFADLLAQYMAFTGDRVAILKGDRSLASLDSESVAFCNVEGSLSRRGLLDFVAKRLYRTAQRTVPAVSRSRSPSFRPIRHRIPVMDQIENGERLDLRGFANLPGWAEKEVVGFFLAGIVSI